MSLFRRNEHSHETPEDQEEGADTETQEAERSHVQELTDIFQESWEKNREEGDPDVSFKFLFSSHTKAQDLHRNLRSELENADIYMPEVFQWSRKRMRQSGRVATGRREPTQIHDEFTVAEEEALYGTGVVVLSPDIPKSKGHLFVEQATELGQNYRSLFSLPFDEAVQKYYEARRDRAAMEQMREKEIMQNIPTLIRKALRKNKALRKKESLSVVLTYGAVHTTLYHALSRTEESEVSRDMEDRPQHTYGYISELTRSYLFGVADPERNKELVARQLISVVFKKAIDRELSDWEATSGEEAKLARMAVDLLTPEDLRDVWDVYLADKEPLTVLAAVIKKGFVLPTTKEGFDELLQSKRKP